MDPKLKLKDVKIEEESLDNEAGSGKKRYFASDEEFEDFCIAPFAVIKETESGVLYCIHGRVFRRVPRVHRE